MEICTCICYRLQLICYRSTLRMVVYLKEYLRYFVPKDYIIPNRSSRGVYNLRLALGPCVGTKYLSCYKCYGADSSRIKRSGDALGCICTDFWFYFSRPSNRGPKRVELRDVSYFCWLRGFLYSGNFSKITKTLQFGPMCRGDYSPTNQWVSRITDMIFCKLSLNIKKCLLMKPTWFPTHWKCKSAHQNENISRC